MLWEVELTAACRFDISLSSYYDLFTVILQAMNKLAVRADWCLKIVV